MNPMNKRSTTLSLAVAAILLGAAGAAVAEPTPPDTSSWECSKCPFPGKGYDSTVEIGGGYLSDSSAKFGDYTGLKNKGGYVLADAQGQATYESGYQISYDLENLGLNSRSVRVDGGKAGQYDFALFYDRVPHYIADTGESIFHGIGGSDLTLPAGWVRSGGTAGMTALDTSLHGIDIGYNRDRYGAGGRYFLDTHWSFQLDYRRDDRSGERPVFGSFGSVSAQLLRPVDDATDRITIAAHYDSAKWFAQLGYYGSFYSDHADALRWQNPFTSFIPAATTGQMALPPGNNYNEIALTAGLRGLPWHTVITLSAATGVGTQDAAFLPYTLTPGLTTAALPMSNLDGQVKVSRVDLTGSMRPLEKLRLRGSFDWDERKDDSKQAAFTSIIHTDLFPVGDDRVNPVYGYERIRLRGTADYDILKSLTAGIGGEYKNVDRKGTAQEVMKEEYDDSYLRLQYHPIGYLGLVVKGGVQEQNPAKRYDLSVAEALGENPLMRKYELAYRHRDYGDFLANLTLGKLPVTLGASLFMANDYYSRSEIGLSSGNDRRYAIDLTWTINPKVTAYISAGGETIDSTRHGSSTFSTPDWGGVVSDKYQTYGGGLQAKVSDKVGFHLDYTYADGNSNTDITGASAGSFPQVQSRQHTFKADCTVGLNDRASLVFAWWYEQLHTHDWAIEGIGPSTLPTVLGLGINPYNYNVNYVTASLRYSFGPPKKAAESAE